MTKNVLSLYSKVAMFTKLLFLFATVSVLSLPLEGYHPKQSRCHCYPVTFETFHKPFEKIYVTPCQVVSMPQGFFYKHLNGQLEKIHSISQDCQGTFMLKIYAQCTHCGRVFNGASAAEGWSCFESRIP